MVAFGEGRSVVEASDECSPGVFGDDLPDSSPDSSSGIGRGSRILNLAGLRCRKMPP